MSPEEAREQIDLAIANGALRRTDNHEERQRLDELYAIAFKDPDATDRPSYLGTDGRNVKVWGDNSAPTSTVFYPPEILRIMNLADPEVRRNEATRLMSEVYDDTTHSHPYWRRDSVAWHFGMTDIIELAKGNK
jgi:hypothetical protein